MTDTPFIYSSSALANIGTIALLRTAAPISGALATTQGSITAGDGLGLTYKGVTGQATSYFTDNGNTIIVPLSGNGSAAWVAVERVFPNYTVASGDNQLPAAGSAGRIAWVTDGAASLVWGATISGGGTAKYLIWDNNSAWTVIGK
jgi:hypothetical protein